MKNRLKGFLIDPGDNAPRILDTIRRLGVQLKYIVLTRSHFDHILALLDVAAATGARIAIHASEAEEIASPGEATVRALGLPAIRIKTRAGRYSALRRRRTLLRRGNA